MSNPIKGKSLLHLCAERDDMEGVKMLLDFGADPKVKDKNEKEPCQLPKDMAITELLGGNPLAVTVRRKAEAEMELRALKIQQLEEERKRSSGQKTGLIRINPKKFPKGVPANLGGHPGGGHPQPRPALPRPPQQHSWVAPGVSNPPPPPVHSYNVHYYPQQRAQVVTHHPTAPPVIQRKISRDSNSRKSSKESSSNNSETENKTNENLILPQDRKISLENRSSEDSDSDSDSER